MICGNGWVYTHIPKTGGVWFRQVSNRFDLGAEHHQNGTPHHWSARFGEPEENLADEKSCAVDNWRVVTDVPVIAARKADPGWDFRRLLHDFQKHLRLLTSIPKGTGRYSYHSPKIEVKQ